MASASTFAPPPLRSAPLRPPPPPCRIPISQSPTPHPRLPPRIAALRTRYRHAGSGSPEDPTDADAATFNEAVSLFNSGDYYRCHDFLEELWHVAEEPSRTLLHGILQCAVGFHHLFNQNHRGAMMEIGEGLCKLRKMGFDDGPFLGFEREVSAVLEFIYQTQMELAACTDDFCLTMDGSDRSYQLLGSFAAGQRLYNLDIDAAGVPYILFCPTRRDLSDQSSRVRVPTLGAREEHLKGVQL